MEQEQIEPLRSDQLQEPGRISLQMLQQILRADLCVAVLTNHNPNVYCGPINRTFDTVRGLW